MKNNKFTQFICFFVLVFFVLLLVSCSDLKEEVKSIEELRQDYPLNNYSYSVNLSSIESNDSSTGVDLDAFISLKEDIATIRFVEFIVKGDPKESVAYIPNSSYDEKQDTSVLTEEEKENLFKMQHIKNDVFVYDIDVSKHIYSTDGKNKDIDSVSVLRALPALPEKTGKQKFVALIVERDIDGFEHQLCNYAIMYVTDTNQVLRVNDTIMLKEFDGMILEEFETKITEMLK